MGSIQDITRLIRKGPELVSQVNSMKLNRKTVVAGAKDATFQYPFLISDTNPVDLASATVQMFDRVYAEYTKTWISMNAMYDITLDPTPTSYLKKLHQNVRFEMAGNFDEDETVESVAEGIIKGTYSLWLNEESGYGVLFNKADKRLAKMMESHREQLSEFLSEYDFSGFMTEADDEYLADVADAIVTSKMNKTSDEKRRGALQDSDKAKAPMLTDKDVKKANDVMPYGIQVRLIALNDKKEFVQYMDLVIGAKAVMHKIPSDEMIENIGRAVQNRSVMFKLLRWTTGEISLIKDIILNIGDIKQDAFNRQKKDPYFNTLKRLRNRKFTTRNLTVPTALIPNATIVISRREVEELKDKYAVDVMDRAVAQKLIESLFLMAFVVLDEGTDTISIMYGGSTSFETYSIDVVQRENRASSNQLSRVIGSMMANVR